MPSNFGLDAGHYVLLKKLINKSFNYIELRDKKGEFSYPVTKAEFKRKKKDSFCFLATT